MASTRPFNGELLLPGPRHLLPSPDYLSERAKRHWDDIVRVLVPAGVVSAIDTTGLALLCESLSDYWEIRGDWQQEKKRLNFAERMGATSAFMKLDAHIREWVREMLLTPASRASRDLPMQQASEAPLDLSVLDADERAAIRQMLERHGERQGALQ